MDLSCAATAGSTIPCSAARRSWPTESASKGATERHAIGLDWTGTGRGRNRLVPRDRTGTGRGTGRRRNALTGQDRYRTERKKKETPRGPPLGRGGGDAGINR